MSVLKLLYFAQGWHLAEKGCSLIAQDFEAWQYGPVIKVVRDEFSKYGDAPIRGRATKFDLLTGSRTVVQPKLADKDATFVASILAAYHQFDPWQLSEMTHEAGSPWDKLWNAEQPVGRLALRIRNDEIREHFVGLARRLKLSYH